MSNVKIILIVFSSTFNTFNNLKLNPNHASKPSLIRPFHKSHILKVHMLVLKQNNLSPCPRRRKVFMLQ